MKHIVTLIPGDGIGPEVTGDMVRTIDASGAKVEFEVAEAGEKVMKKEGTPLPEYVLDSVKKNKTAIKGPITTPVGSGFRSVNVALRQALDLYACLRPAKLYPGVPSPYESVDLVIVRENTEDLYAGIEFFKGTPEAKAVIEKIVEQSKKKIREDSAISIKPISVFCSERIIKYAYDYAVKNNRKKVTCVHKANIMKATDGLFLETARRVGQNYPSIKTDDCIVDNMCMQLVKKPQGYDVLCAPNLYGDIISDLCAGLIGGLGMAPGANIGEKYAVFEPVHGSAPKYAGMDKVNPTATISSGILMLRHLKEEKAADRIENALKEVYLEGKVLTYDMGGNAKGSEFTTYLIEKMS
jgi:isocitrate dehydrogenase (NAD+)